MEKKTLSKKKISVAKRRMTVLERQLAGLKSVMRGNIVTNCGRRCENVMFQPI